MDNDDSINEDTLPEGVDVDSIDKAKLYRRVSDPADPNRCQANNAHGQCDLIAVPPSKYCMLHGGKPSERTKLNNYRLNKWMSRVESMANSDGIKSLRDEIGILRMLLEERMNSIGDVTELLMYSHTISDLVNRIERIVLTCHKIEKSLGNLIDRSEVVRIVDQIVCLIGENITDQDVLAKIAVKAEKILSLEASELDDE